jgi:hypothetical protein
MSSPAPSPEMQPNARPATAARSHPAFDGVRRLPVRNAQPPFDDEVVAYRPWPIESADTSGSTSASAGVADPRQGALTLAFALPNGLPAMPAIPASLPPREDGPAQHLRLVPNDVADELQLEAGEASLGRARKRPARELGDDEFGPRQTPRTQLPDPKPWAGRLVQAIVEVVSGVRPVSQLVRWTSADVYESVQMRMRTDPAAAVVPARLAAATARLAPVQFAEVVRSVHVSEPADGIAEICAILQQGRRCRAIALRLEGLDGRWQCTALHIG